MNHRHDLTATLRTLDVADPPVSPTSARARADLLRILATDPSPSPALPSQQVRTRATAGPHRPRPAGWAGRRVAVAASLVAVLAAGLVVLPALTGGDRAFATWTATPQGLTATERADAVASCRTSQLKGAGAPYAADLAGAEPAIADRRGVWTTVILAGADGFSALCITDGSAPLLGTLLGALYSPDMIGSVGTPTASTPPGPRDLVATDLGTGTMTAGDISLAAGVAGSDVAAVTYFSTSHGAVSATVAHGHFALWLPGDDLAGASAGVQVEVTYRDGTTGTSRLSL